MKICDSPVSELGPTDPYRHSACLDFEALDHRAGGIVFAGMGWMRLILGMSLLAAMLLLGACGGAGGDGPCVGTKCDDPNGNPTPHRLAVLDCDSKYEGPDEDLAVAVAAVRSYHNCLVGADDSTIGAIKDNLLHPNTANRSNEEIQIVFDEFRYASLCTDLESASNQLGDTRELLVLNCEVQRERSLAEMIDAFVDFAGQRVEVTLSEERPHFEECYRLFDDALVQGDLVGVAREALVDCTAEDLRTHATLIRDAHCEIADCADPLIVLSFVKAGFETAITTSERACQMLVDASVYRDKGAPQQVQACQLAVHAQLKTAVTTGLTLLL